MSFKCQGHEEQGTADDWHRLEDTKEIKIIWYGSLQWILEQKSKNINEKRWNFNKDEFN